MLVCQYFKILFMFFWLQLQTLLGVWFFFVYIIIMLKMYTTNEARSSFQASKVLVMLLGISESCAFRNEKKILHYLWRENLRLPLVFFTSVALKIDSDIGELIIILVINSCQKHNVRVLAGCRVSLNKLSFVFCLTFAPMIE